MYILPSRNFQPSILLAQGSLELQARTFVKVFITHTANLPLRLQCEPWLIYYFNHYHLLAWTAYFLFFCSLAFANIETTRRSYTLLFVVRRCDSNSDHFFPMQGSVTAIDMETISASRIYNALNDEHRHKWGFSLVKLSMSHLARHGVYLAIVSLLFGHHLRPRQTNITLN
jgi:hypothetical protein